MGWKIFGKRQHSLIEIRSLSPGGQHKEHMQEICATYFSIAAGMA
jgi:hypothetical protein